MSLCGRVNHHLVLASKSKGQKIGFTACFTSVKGKVKYITSLLTPLTLVKVEVKYVTTLTLTRSFKA